jgi:hypothetical protein
MPTLSTPDPTAPIACALPPRQAIDRLRALEDVVGDRLLGVHRGDATITLDVAANDPEVEQRLISWAEEEKNCCAFLGFAIETSPERVVLTIEAPPGAEATLDGIDWIVGAAGGRAV